MRLKRLFCLVLAVFFSLSFSFGAFADKNGYAYENGQWNYYSNGKIVSLQGVDISEWNESIDWAKLKSAGISFVFLRAGYRGWGKAGTLCKDSMFDSYIKAAHAAGLNIGAYFFSQAISASEAQAEAEFTLSIIAPYRDWINYPVVFDTEDAGTSEARTYGISRRTVTDCAKRFTDTVRKANYTPMIYASPYWLQEHTYESEVTSMADMWVAHYRTSSPTDYSPLMIWQYTEEGKVLGCDGYVDRNISFYDYSTLAFKISFNANGGTGNMADKICYYGLQNYYPACSFQKSGYAFAGWNAYRASDGKWLYTDGKGNSAWYVENNQPSGWTKNIYRDGAWVGTTTKVKNDIVTFYAQWAKLSEPTTTTTTTTTTSTTTTTTTPTTTTSTTTSTTTTITTSTTTTSTASTTDTTTEPSTTHESTTVTSATTTQPVTIFPTTTTAPRTLPSGRLIGDVNNDGKFTIIDARCAMLNIIYSQELASEDLQATDIDNDGVLTILDIQIMLKMRAKGY